MKRPLKAKLIAAAILILILTGFSHVYRARDQQMGREAFLAHQAKRYDTVVTHPSLPGMLAATAFLFGSLFTIYELLVIGLSKFVSDDPVPDDHI
jgi:hypothetical protein